MTKPFRLPITALFCLVLAAGCSSSMRGLPTSPQSTMPKSTSPALLPAAPMAKTAILPASTMLSVTPKTAIQGANYTQIPGAATFAAAAPDGSLWVLSNGPAGNDKYIWHYVNGSWTNISGLASRLAVSQTGGLYAINSGGGVYSYNQGTWTALGGGASDITIDYDGSVFVLSNGNTAGSDQAVWRYSSSWAQSQGSGVRIAASYDQGSYGWLGGGNVPGGIYILSSTGGIYHEFKGTPGFVQLPGSASEITPTNIGGFFVLGYPRNASGNSLYYFDLDSSSSAYSAQTGAGVAISASSTALYVIGAGGGIYSTPIKATQQYAFGGSSASVAVTAGQTPQAASLASYGGITATIQFPQATAGNGTLYVTDAFNNGDINPNTLPADNASAGFTPVLYISIYNPNATISFGQITPQVTLTKAGGFGGATTCEVDYYGSQGSVRGWGVITGSTGTISGNTVTLPSATLPGTNTVDFRPGQGIPAVSCR